MIQICTLYSLEDVSTVYYINKKRQVVNTETGYIKKVWITSNGYPSVSLATNNGGGRNVTMHKLVALAFIKNAPYNIIEHINDDKLDYRPKNLRFSNQSQNVFSAIRNGKKPIIERTFKLLLKNGKIYIGSMKEIAKKTGIARATLYCHFYFYEKNGHGMLDSHKKSRICEVTLVK